MLMAAALVGCLGGATSSKVAASSSPTISNVAPSSGPTSGGTAVVISGNNFGSGAGVQFGGSPATAVQVENSTQIRVVVPPASKGSVAVTVRNSDGEIATDANAFTFINSALQVTSTALPVGKKGATFSTALAATGGTPPYSWSVVAGALPNGLQMDSLTGKIAGTPALSGNYSFMIKVQDAAATSTSATFSLSISADPTPAISDIAPNSGFAQGGTTVLITGSNFRPGVVVQFGGDAAASVQVVNSSTVQAVTPKEPVGAVNVTLQEIDGQIAKVVNGFTFAAEPAPNADVVVDTNQTVSETGGNDMAAAKNIFASASAPESDGGLFPDWNLISSELSMKRMRNINGLGDCALGSNGKLTGCTRLNNDLLNMKAKNLTPHVVVGQWAPASIGGNPLNWNASQWAQYDALCYAIVNYVVNQYGGTGFSEALFEVENEVDTTTTPT